MGPFSMMALGGVATGLPDRLARVSAACSGAKMWPKLLKRQRDCLSYALSITR